MLTKLHYSLRPVNALCNLLRGRPLDEPAVQLHVYHLPGIVPPLNRQGVGQALLVYDHFDSGTFDAVVVIAQHAPHPT